VLEDAALLDEGETERGDEGGEADEESDPDD
jgi:hypothetical protein